MAYREAGADVVYAPGLTDPAYISALVEAAGTPVNVLALPDAPDVGELERARRPPRVDGVAAGRTAYGALVAAARELRGDGRSDPARPRLTPDDRAGLFT